MEADKKEADKKRVLALFKHDLGIISTAKDDYFESLITACEAELKKKFTINLSEMEDMMLLSDFSAWRYRNRISGEAMPQNITERIRNRSIRGRLSGTVTR